MGIFSRSFGRRVVKEISQSEIEEWLNTLSDPLGEKHYKLPLVLKLLF